MKIVRYFKSKIFRFLINAPQKNLVSRFKSCDQTVEFEGFTKIEGFEFISIGSHTKIQRDTYLTAWGNYANQKFRPKLEIGANCNIGAWNHITCVNKIIIGDGLLTGKWVTITDNSHGTTDYENMQIPPSQREIHSKGPVCIGKNVWIGDKATILPGVKIGEGAIIGANTVVNKDIPAYSVAVGQPARILEKNDINH